MSNAPEKYKTKRVIIITDSTGMPRPGLIYRETWPAMIKQAFQGVDIIHRPQRGGTTLRLVQEGGGGIDLLELYEPSLAIIQMGVTDCAPRLFRKDGLELWFINNLLTTSTRNRYIRFIRKTRGRIPELAHVSPENFRSNVCNYVDRAAGIGCNVIIIGILPAIPSLILKSPLICGQIDMYNGILRDIASSRKGGITFIQPLEGINTLEQFYLDDTHLNHEGSVLLFNSIRNVMDSVLV